MKPVGIDKDYVWFFEFGARGAEYAVTNGLRVDDQSEPHYKVDVDFDGEVDLALAVHLFDVVGHLQAVRGAAECLNR